MPGILDEKPGEIALKLEPQVRLADTPLENQSVRGERQHFLLVSAPHAIIETTGEHAEFEAGER